MANVNTAMMELHQCLCDRLASAVEKGVVTDTCGCFLVYGDTIPSDYCGPEACGGDSCGMAWVRLAQITADELTDPRTRNCVTQLVAQLEVGISRCTQAEINSQNNLPGEDEYLAETVTGLEDLALISQAVACCDIRGMSIQSIVPVGPEGGCLMTVASVRVELD